MEPSCRRKERAEGVNLEHQNKKEYLVGVICLLTWFPMRLPPLPLLRRRLHRWNSLRVFHLLPGKLSENVLHLHWMQTYHTPTVQ